MGKYPTSLTSLTSLAEITHLVASYAYDPYWGTEVFLALDAPESLQQRLWEARYVDFWLGYRRHLQSVAQVRSKIEIQNGESNVYVLTQVVLGSLALLS